MQISFNPEDDKDNNNGKSIVVDAENNLNLFVDIVDLMPNTEYHISVIAYTSVGPGVAANLSVTTSTENRKSICYA